VSGGADYEFVESYRGRFLTGLAAIRTYCSIVRGHTRHLNRGEMKVTFGIASILVGSLLTASCGGTATVSKATPTPTSPVVTGSLREFPVPTPAGGPLDITTGPDGNLWFTEFPGNRIGRITPEGSISEFPLPNESSYPTTIVTGPDGNLWFTELVGNRIGTITPAGVIRELTLPRPSSGPISIATGPDKNLWFAEFSGASPAGPNHQYAGNAIGRITTAGVITEFPLPTPDSGPHIITLGPDGNLWFTESYAGRVGRITPQGQITEINLPDPKSFPVGITAGPDRNLWFIEESISRVGRITPAGAITNFEAGANGTFEIIRVGPDGNLWLCELDANTIARITTSGRVSGFALPHPGSGPLSIASGPDGQLWFTELEGNRIGVVAPG
jgi:streptogramin lyase